MESWLSSLWSVARRRKRRPRPRPESHLPELDLHGETADTARRRAERWLRERRAEGERTVVVITGRGLHSMGPPVLPGEIEAVLGELRGTTVRTWERRIDGGAFRIHLIPPERPAGPRRPVAVRLPPDLRARAEASLRDLGIEPTPALLAAEAKRLASERERGNG